MDTCTWIEYAFHLLAYIWFTRTSLVPKQNVSKQHVKHWKKVKASLLTIPILPYQQEQPIWKLQKNSRFPPDALFSKSIWNWQATWIAFENNLLVRTFPKLRTTFFERAFVRPKRVKALQKLQKCHLNPYSRMKKPNNCFTGTMNRNKLYAKSACCCKCITVCGRTTNSASASANTIHKAHIHLIVNNQKLHIVHSLACCLGLFRIAISGTNVWPQVWQFGTLVDTCFQYFFDRLQCDQVH